MTNTVDVREIEQFSLLSNKWWDKSGPFSALHRLSNARIEFIKNNFNSPIIMLTAMGSDKNKIESLVSNNDNQSIVIDNSENNSDNFDNLDDYISIPLGYPSE